MYYPKRSVLAVSMRPPAISLIFLIAGTLIISGCAYFNTFYNALNYFQTAEEEISKQAAGEKLSKKGEEALDKTIVNCNIVLEDFPDAEHTQSELKIITVRDAGIGVSAHLAQR